MKDFCERLNDSDWIGVISEVGIGLEFTRQFLLHDGASNTILSASCPYGEPPYGGYRAVSLENAQQVSEGMYSWSHEIARRAKKQGREFGLSITGAHYTDRPSHAWICLTTKSWQAYMHVTIMRSQDREWVANVLKDRIVWFMSACLLENKSWQEHIEEIRDSLDTHNIDVLYAPGVSDVERMMLLTPKNPLAFENGKFIRVVDAIRASEGQVYPGAFNPPTIDHLSQSALYELSQLSKWKAPASIQDMLHRMNMLSISGKTVLVTQCPMFVDKQELLLSYGAPPEFIVGMDVWNNLTADEQYPNANFLSEQLADSFFVVRLREGVPQVESETSKTMTYMIEGGPEGVMQSTEVRQSSSPRDHEYLTEAVGRYIERHNLYGQD